MNIWDVRVRFVSSSSTLFF